MFGDASVLIKNTSYASLDLTPKKLWQHSKFES